MPEVFLAAQDLQKSFNGNKAWRGFLLPSIKGNFGLLGPNGAGKTTTIRILSTVLEADSGDVTVGGYSARKNPAEVRKLIGVCPQDLCIYEDLSHGQPDFLRANGRP